MGGVRKKTRHCSKWGHKAEFIQVSYFPYTDRGKAKGRKSRYQESTPKQKRLNDKRSRRYFEALVRSNFGEGDICITPTYDDEHRPADEQEAAKKLSNYISRINYHRRKAGLPKAKWVAVTELTKTGRIHHHIIMDGGLSRDKVEELWRQGFCNADRLRPDKKKGLAALIAYLSKDPKGRRRWTSSHGNLTKPWTTVNDQPKAMSRKKMALMKDLPEDSDYMSQLIERDNPGYELIDVEKEYREDTSQWYFFARMKAKNPHCAQVDGG